MNSRTLCVAISLVSLATIPAFAQSSDPFGPQTSVPKATVEGGGWVECYSASYDTHTGDDVGTIMATCTGDKMMLACGEAGSDTLTVLSQAATDDVFTDPGDGQTDSHVANGAQWYFSQGGMSAGSWGFAAVGDNIFRASCDTAPNNAVGSTNPEEKLCWHIDYGGGWRCGETQDLNDSTAWTKYVYTARAESVPTLSALQLAVLALLLVGIALVALRRAVASH